MQVSEVFKSCQGEGPGARLPTVFVRLSGCNLALAGTPCVWCDTKYAQAASGKKMSTRKVAELVEGLSGGCRRVCVTGGEPLYQISELVDLVDILQFREHFVEVFTNGAWFPASAFFQKVDSWVVDVKCPSSGVAHKCRPKLWLGATRPQDAVKFVVGDKEDLEYVTSALLKCGTRAQVFVSPCITEDVSEKKQRAWLRTVWSFCVAYNHSYGLQLHKVVFGNKRGV